MPFQIAGTGNIRARRICHRDLKPENLMIRSAAEAERDLVREFLNDSPFGLSADSIDLLAAALEFDPARRPKDAREFASRIQAEWKAG